MKCQEDLGMSSNSQLITSGKQLTTEDVRGQFLKTASEVPSVTTQYSRSPVDVFDAAPFRRHQQKHVTAQKQKCGPVKAVVPFSQTQKSNERPESVESSASVVASKNVQKLPQTTETVAVKPVAATVEFGHLQCGQREIASRRDPRIKAIVKQVDAKVKASSPVGAKSSNDLHQYPEISQYPSGQLAMRSLPGSIPVINSVDVEEEDYEGRSKENNLHKSVLIRGRRNTRDEGKSRKKCGINDDDNENDRTGKTLALPSGEPSYGSLKSNRSFKDQNVTGLPSEFANLGFSEEDSDALTSLETLKKESQNTKMPAAAAAEPQMPRPVQDPGFLPEGSHTLPRAENKKRRRVPGSTSMTPVGYKIKSTLV